MTIERYTSSEALRNAAVFPALLAFIEREQHPYYFQSPEYFEFIEPVEGFRPVFLIARDAQQAVVGSVLGVYQRDGGGIKSWFSRRMILNGGPLGGEAAVDILLPALLKDAAGQAIYVEFRNHLDASHLSSAFERHGFHFKPHLNFLLELKGEEATLKKLSSNRRRQIRNSVTAGASWGEAISEKEVEDLYLLFAALYRDKVKKPLPAYSLFKRLHDSPGGRVFVVKFQGRVIGGSAGPVYKNHGSYQWYAYGDNSNSGVHASVLAAWAQIEDAARNGYSVFDFMGAGQPGQGYGVHEFKSSFGGTEVSPGRYEKILNRPLYRFGVMGLKVYQRLTGRAGGKK